MHPTRRASLLSLGGVPLALGACATADAQSPTAQSPGLTPAQHAAWLDRYKQAWETRDPAAAGALFSADASYHEMPFDAPMQCRAAIEAYWARVTAGQANVRFSYEIVASSGDQGVSQWHATFNSVPDGATIDLDGVFVCRFADALTVNALREWWHVRVTPAA